MKCYVNIWFFEIMHYICYSKLVVWITEVTAHQWTLHGTSITFAGLRTWH
jgi:hypothetical protein